MIFPAWHFYSVLIAGKFIAGAGPICVVANALLRHRQYLP